MFSDSGALRSSQQTRTHSYLKPGVWDSNLKEAHIAGPHATFGHVVHVAMLI